MYLIKLKTNGKNTMIKKYHHIYKLEWDNVYNTIDEQGAFTFW